VGAPGSLLGTGTLLIAILLTVKMFQKTLLAHRLPNMSRHTVAPGMSQLECLVSVFGDFSQQKLEMS
jgi:hypothetical protein